MLKEFVEYFKKDFRLILSARFFVISFISLILYSVFINWGYMKLLGNDAYITYAFEMDQRKAITTQLLYVELIAVGLLGIASVVFKEKHMGVLRVHGIMPVHNSLAVLSKLLIFLASDIIFTVLMIAINVGLHELITSFFGIIINITILSLIMSMTAIFLTLILRDFKQFSLIFLILVLILAVPVIGDIIPRKILLWHPFYHIYNHLYDSISGIKGTDISYVFTAVIVITILFVITVLIYSQKAKKEV